MGFREFWEQTCPLETLKRIESATAAQVAQALSTRFCNEEGLAALLSPSATPFLEAMAQRAHDETLRHFGRQILLFTPIYISNHCVNQCAYCGFNVSNRIERRHLSLAEVDIEARAISKTGLKHILLLTGEAPSLSTPDYIGDSISLLSTYFTSVGIEIYPVDEKGYARFIDAGADTLTLYQETYNKSLYKTLHPAGPKRNFFYRLEAPERAARARIRGITIGGLLGLDNWRREAFYTALHARWLLDTFPDVELGISFPRMRPHAGGFKPDFDVTDADIVQMMIALRIFLPQVGMTVSTRESPSFRNHILPLGVTRMSAGSCTSVGSHTLNEGSGQFEISDGRSVVEMAESLNRRGYQPVYQDWRRH
ncbi:MAG: 2-iminoacetate synthase ThiH [Desulfobacterales bacterium]|nr:2-iminoacetate synthase ThiH [Desulfobacterales bacterium]